MTKEDQSCTEKIGLEESPNKAIIINELFSVDDRKRYNEKNKMSQTYQHHHQTNKISTFADTKNIRYIIITIGV